jgi:hypothetical protein
MCVALVESGGGKFFVQVFTHEVGAADNPLSVENGKGTCTESRK